MKKSSYYRSRNNYLKYLNNVAVIKDDELNELFIEYKNGNYDAFNKIVMGNLRLVGNICSSIYSRSLIHLNYEDLFQEGVVELIKAIPSYDPLKGKFSTYVTSYIVGGMISAINTKENCINIKNPTIVAKVNELSRIYQTESLTTSDEKLISKLKLVNDANSTAFEKLEIIKQCHNYYSFVSIDEELNSVENICLKDVLPDKNNKLLDQIAYLDQDRLLLVLREYLGELKYYILYYRYLTFKKYSRNKIGEKIGVSFETIRVNEENALKMVKSLLNSDYLLSSYYKKIDNKYNHLYSKLTYKPYSVNYLIIYNYLLNNYDPIFSLIFYYDNLCNINYSHEQIIQLLGINFETYKTLYQVVRNIVSDLIKSIDYCTLQLQIKNEKKSKLFNITPKLINNCYEDVYSLLNYSTLEEIKNNYDLEILSKEEQLQLETYLNEHKSKIYAKDYALIFTSLNKLMIYKNNSKQNRKFVPIREEIA